jgi:predicted ribosome quality control (RQC) complex YloA/Tae2 family protein
MKLKIFWNRSVHENAAYYYQLAKEDREKIKGLEQAMKQTEKEMQEVPEKKEVRVKREKQWFEKFHHSMTSEGKLMIGGRSAQQNDQVVAKHMEDNDLFFHADIQGGSAVILKDGVDATDDEMKEAAQFAACFSKAWINANAAVDVYSVKKEQLSKHATGGYIPTGAFAITGERRWFRSTELRLRIGMTDEGVELVANLSKKKLSQELQLIPSKKGKTKGPLAKSLAKRFGIHPDELLEVLPNGRSNTVLI